MARNSHNTTIDESAKPWSSKFKAGKNTHGQTWEDIFGTPEHPMLTQESDSVKVHNGEHESLPDQGDQVQAVRSATAAGLQLSDLPAGEEGNERQDHAG